MREPTSRSTSSNVLVVTIMPPIINGNRIPRLIAAKPRPKIDLALADAATTNSAAFMVHMTRLGDTRPVARSAGVITGPQPPQPVASINPPISPSDTKNLKRGRPLTTPA